jgi:hypothetical protein
MSGRSRPAKKRRARRGKPESLKAEGWRMRREERERERVRE